MSDYQPVPPPPGQVPPPEGQPGYPQPGQQGYPQPGQGYPQPGQPGFPPPPPYGEVPPQQQGFSGLAITGFIFAFIVPLVGFILSLIAIFQTGPGKKRGRGLSIAGVIVSVVLMALGVVLVIVFASSTAADPACASGKDAILNNSQSDLTPEKVQAIVTGLDAAAAEAKNDDVRAAMKTASADYNELLKAMKSGNPPAGLDDKLTADLDKIDDLCTIGS